MSPDANEPLSDSDLFVQRYLAGETSAEEKQEALQRDPNLARRLEELDSVVSWVDGVAAEEHAVLTEAEQRRFAAGEEGVRAFFSDRLPPPARRSRALIAALVAVAATLVLWLGGFFDGSGDPGTPVDPVLGESGVVLLEAGRGPSHWGPFRFRLEVDRERLPDLAIRVWSGESFAPPALIESPRLTDLEWNPEPETTEGWPDVIT